MSSRRMFLKYAFTVSAGGLLAACRPAATSTPQPVPPTKAPASAAPATAAPVKEVQVLASGLDFPEGPAFDPQGGLWCTEMGKGNLVRFVDGKVQRIPTGGRPNSLAFDRQGRAWVPDSAKNTIRRYNPAAEQWEDILDSVDGQPLLAPNDLAFDQQGNLVFTCPNYASQAQIGYVVCLKPDGTAHKIVDRWFRPNGLDFMEGGKALVVADTGRKALFKGAWDAESGTWSDPQEWVKIGGAEGPDGMAPGADGRLYCAIYGDGVVRVVGADGKIAEELALPGRNPTNAAFDPSGKLGMVVTESEKGLLLSLPWIQPGPAIFDGGEAW